MRRIVLLSLFLVAAYPAVAPGQTAPELRRHVLSEIRRGGCSLTSFELIHQGPLGKETRPLSIVHYGTEGCGGGNSSGSTLVAYLREGGRFRALPMTTGRSQPLYIQQATVQGGTIIVEGVSVGPDDPRCCPTLRSRQAYTVTDGRISPINMP